MKRLASVLLCSAILAFAPAISAEESAGEPEAETLAVVAEGFDVRIPVPDGWVRIDDLETETPVPQGYRRLAVLAPQGVTQRTTMGIPSTVVDVLLYLETVATPVSAQSFADGASLDLNGQTVHVLAYKVAGVEQKAGTYSEQKGTIIVINARRGGLLVIVR